MCFVKYYHAYFQLARSGGFNKLLSVYWLVEHFRGKIQKLTFCVIIVDIFDQLAYRQVKFCLRHFIRQKACTLRVSLRILFIELRHSLSAVFFIEVIHLIIAKCLQWRDHDSHALRYDSRGLKAKRLTSAGSQPYNSIMPLEQ